MLSLRSPGTLEPVAPVEGQPGNRTEVKTVCFFMKHNYKISVTVGQKQALIVAITPVFDSGAGPNIIYLRRIAELSTIDIIGSEHGAHRRVEPRIEGFSRNLPVCLYR